MTRSIAALAVAASLFAAPASAVPTTLRMNATVVLYANDLGLLPFTATAGDSFYVDYTFESGVADSNASPEIGTYDNAVLAYTAVVNGVSLSPGVSTVGNFIQVLNDYGSPGDSSDAYNVASGFLAVGENSYSLYALLENPFNSAPVEPFTSADLPLVPWDLSAFTNRTLDIAVFTTVNGQLRSNQLSGAITSITTPTVVPAPGALWLLATGIGVLGIRARRRVSKVR
jgi:hypothetical protein